MLLYGVAGSGKTNLLLNIIACSCRRVDGHFYYISTEGALQLHRAVKMGIAANNVALAAALSQEHLLDLLLEAIRRGNVAAILVDTINSFYRMYATDEGALRIFMVMLALLDSIAETSTYVLAAAQIREEEGEESIVGAELLLPWADVVVKLSRMGRGLHKLSFIKPSLPEDFVFMITDRGIAWLRQRPSTQRSSNV